MTLNPTQRAFLTKALGVNVKKKLIGKTVNEKATSAFDKYAQVEATVIRLVNELKTLPHTNFLVAKYENDVRSAQAVAKSVSDKDPEGAREKFQSACTTLTGIKEKLEADLGTIKKYGAAKKQADEWTRQLTALKRANTPDYDLPLLAIIGDAEMAASAGNFLEALNKLKPAKSTYDKQKKQAEQDQKSELKEARYKPVYEDKRRRVQEGLARLQNLPGTEKQRAKLQELLNAGQDMEDEDFNKAYHELEGLRGTIKEAEKASKKFVESVGGPAFQLQRRAAEDNLKKFEQLAGVSDPQTVQESRKKIDDTLKGLEGTPSQAQITRATSDLQKLADRLKTLITELENAKKEAERLYDTTRKAVTVQLAQVAPSDVLSPFLQRFNAASTLLGAQNYLSALKELKSLNADLPAVYDPLKAAYDEWVDAAKKANAALATYEKAISIANDHVGRFASELHTRFKQAENDVRTTHDYAKAKQVAQEIVDKEQEVKNRIKAYQDAEKERNKAKTEFNSQVDFVTSIIKALADAGGDTSAFQTALDQAKRDFDQGLQEALAPGAKKYSEIESTGKAALQQLVRDVNAVLTDPKALGDSKTAAANKARQAQFSKLQETIKGLLKTLGEDDPGAVRPFQMRLDNAVRTSSTGVTDQLVKDLEQLEKDIQGRIEANANRVQTEAKKGADLAKKLLKEIDGLQKSHKDYVAYLNTLRDEVNAGLGMTESTVLTVVLEGVRVLTQLEQKIENVKTANEKGKTGNNFAAVDAKLEEFKKKLEAKVVGECVPSKQKILLHRLKNELPGVCKALEPSAALAGPVKEFGDQVQAAVDAANRAQQRRAKLKTDAAEALKELEGLEGAPRLKASLEARIKSCASPGEDGEINADLDLQIIRKQIKEAIDHPDKKTLMEKKQVAVEFENEKAGETWKAAVDVFKKNELREAEAVHGETPRKDRDEGRYKDIQDTLKEAEKLAGQGNYVLANEKLADARRLARDFISNPFGAKTTARNNLKSGLAKWKTVVAAYIRDLGALKNAIESEAKTDPSVDPKPATQAIDKVLHLFDPIRFDKEVQVLEEDNTGTPVKRRAKEICLRYVRQYQAILKSDPVLAHLRTNPFSAFSTTALEDRLRDLETNFLRAED